MLRTRFPGAEDDHGRAAGEKPINDPKNEPEGACRKHLLGNCLGQTVAPAFQELRHEASARHAASNEANAGGH